MIKNRRRRMWVGTFSLFLLFITVFFCNCDNEMDPYSVPVGTPPDLSKPSEIISFFPDSGGMGTQLIINGNNFGSDTSYIKVTVNGKKARVIGSNGSAIYAIIPSRADTGLVKVFIGRDADIKEYAFEGKFKYIFKQNVSTIAGSTEGITDGPLSEAKLRRPSWITFDRDGLLYFAENGEGENGEGGIRRIKDGAVSTLIRSNTGPFRRPRAIVFGIDTNQDTLWVANDRNDNDESMAVGIMLRNNDFQTLKPFIRDRQNNYVDINPVTGDIFYNRYSWGHLYRWNEATSDKVQLADLDGDNVEFSSVFSQDGKTIYVIVRNKHRIMKGTYNFATKQIENLTNFVGSGEAGYVNGQGTMTRFDQPCQGAVDEEGNLYVADRYNHCIRKITSEGVVTTWAGQGRDKGGYMDGDPLKAQFKSPEGLAFGPDGALYVGDFDNHRIRKILIE